MHITIAVNITHCKLSSNTICILVMPIDMHMHLHFNLRTKKHNQSNNNIERGPQLVGLIALSSSRWPPCMNPTPAPYYYETCA